MLQRFLTPLLVRAFVVSGCSNSLISSTSSFPEEEGRQCARPGRNVSGFTCLFYGGRLSVGVCECLLDSSTHMCHTLRQHRPPLEPAPQPEAPSCSFTASPFFFSPADRALADPHLHCPLATPPPPPPLPCTCLTLSAAPSSPSSWPGFLFQLRSVVSSSARQFNCFVALKHTHICLIHCLF